MPSFQWYSSAKQPPGQRSTGILIFLQRLRPRRCGCRACWGSELSSPTQIALVDAAAQVLGEMAVDVPVDRVLALVGLDGQLRRLALGRDQAEPKGTRAATRAIDDYSCLHSSSHILFDSCFNS